MPFNVLHYFCSLGGTLGPESRVIVMETRNVWEEGEKTTLMNNLDVILFASE